jgi:flagellar M-ring protein FliF
MDFLNKSFAQLSELFRSMTPGARVTAGLLLAVVVVSVGYLFRESASGPDAFLFGGAALSDGQLTRVEAAIAQAGLSGAVREGNRIRVPTGQQSKFLAAVADGGALPPNFNTILEDAIGKGGPWESRDQTRERLKIAKQQTLGEIVRAMPWVESAVVLYDEKDTRTSRSIMPVKQASASVSVKPIVGEMLDPLRAKNIQKLVASAVNMQPSDVVVTNLGDGGLNGSNSQMTAELFEDGSLMQTKVAFEAQRRESIMNALNYIPGVRVEVNADFNDTYEQHTRSLKPDKSATTPSRTSESKQESTQTTSKGGGQPGVTANGPNKQAASESQQNTSKTTNTLDETDNVVAVEEDHTLRKGYTPKDVSATVVVPSSYLESVWKLNNPTANAPPKPNDLQLVETNIKPKIENIVAPLLVLKEVKANAEDTYKRVNVVFLPTLPAPAIVPPSVASTATSWLGQYWNTLAMLGVALFSLLVLRSVVNSKPAEISSGSAISSPGLTLHADEAGGTTATDSTADPHDDRPRLRLRKGSTLRDDLVEIVREDPNAAADILRSWIAKAS